MNKFSRSLCPPESPGTVTPMTLDAPEELLGHPTLSLSLMTYLTPPATRLLCEITAFLVLMPLSVEHVSIYELILPRPHTLRRQYADSPRHLRNEECCSG